MFPGRSQRILQVLSCLVVAFSLISLVLFFYQSIRNHNYEHGNDLTSYLKAAEWFWDGHNPYTPKTRRFIYPLFLLIVGYPLSFLQNSYLAKAITAGLWSLAAYFAFFQTILASWRVTGRQGSATVLFRRNLLFLSLLVLLLHPYLQDEFLNGQVNLFVLGGTAGFFIMLQRGKQLLAALLLAVAASLKVSPAFCLLFVLFSRQYRTIPYFIVFTGLFTVLAPSLINTESLTYYRYFITDVMPGITGSDFEGGFRSYSILSTLSYLFNIHWYPPLKIAAVGILALGLVIPVAYQVGPHYAESGANLRFVAFSAMVSVLPLTFPMSESHHLLILTLPFICILNYWEALFSGAGKLWWDRLSVWLFISVAVLHIGQGLKATPLRLIGLIGIYVGMVWLLRQLTQQQLPRLRR